MYEIPHKYAVRTYFLNLMLMSTGYLAPLAPMVIPGSQYSNFIFNICFVICHIKKTRVQIEIVVVVVKSYFLRVYAKFS